MKVNIPIVINDYNQWMNGVDIVNELIEHYRVKLQRQRKYVDVDAIIVISCT